MSVSAPPVLYALYEELGRELYVESQKDIPPDVRAALRRALERESSPSARAVLNTMLKAISLGDEQRNLVCQDTGIPIFWIDIGTRFSVDAARLTEALARGVEQEHLQLAAVNRILRPGKAGVPATRIGQDELTEFGAVFDGAGLDGSDGETLLQP